MGTTITNKKRNPFAEGVRKITIIAALAGSAIGVYIWYSPTGNKAVYGNKVSTYITTEAGRKAEVAWLVKNGFNTYAGYGMSSYLKSNPSYVQDFVLRCRRAGILDVGFIYGSESTVLNELDKYQKSCPNDSMKFSHVVSEIEQYQSGVDRPKFYNTIRVVYQWCQKNKLKAYIYQGWLNEVDADSIVAYSDRIYLHAYGVYSNYSDAGSWVHGYTKSRALSLANSYEKKMGNKEGKYSMSMLYSCENPDPTKTQFGYKYFLTKTVDQLQSAYLWYTSTHTVPSIVGKRIEVAGSVLFVEDQYKKIKP